MHTENHLFFFLGGCINTEMAVEYYDFGPYKIQHSSVFYTSDLSFAFVNLRPAVPGMVPPSPL